MVTVLDNVYTRMPFKVNVNRKEYMVTCPVNTRPEQLIKIESPSGGCSSSSSSSGGGHQQHLLILKPKIYTVSGSGSGSQMYYVTVPDGVYTMMPFQVKVNGQTMRVTCPANALPGQREQLVLPNTSSTNMNTSSSSK